MATTSSSSISNGTATSSSSSSSTVSSSLNYMSGMDNEHSTEALPGALPIGQNSPQKCSYGLYAEQLSGTAFTVPRARNRRSWLYRIRPAVMHSKFTPITSSSTLVSSFANEALDPNQMRWFPPPLLENETSSISTGSIDFLHGLWTMGGAGDASMKSGLGIHMYNCNSNMGHKVFYNSDGDMLIVPQVGNLLVITELGKLYVTPKEIIVIPRGIRFKIDVEGPSRGYICEIFNGHFQLPDLGPIGANGLANARDFYYPVAAYEDNEIKHTVVTKFGGKLFEATVNHSPFDVVAWHGNYAPFKYDLSRFNTMNSVSYDHPDPSIYTVLTVPTDTPGVALCDFVIFPPRWMVMDHSFRPPYYHRNTMSEFMGMIWGKYDAKVGFQPGGASLHSCMTPHGPDADTFIHASNADLVPQKFEGGLAFMFETTLMLHLTQQALHAPHRDYEYQKCWSALPRCFNPNQKDFSQTKLVPRPLTAEETTTTMSNEK